MQTNTVSYEVADSLFKTIVECLTHDLETLGISETDMAIAVGKEKWQRHQITNVLRTMKSVIYGTLEIHGLPKFPVPAEYAAQAIHHIASPTNRQLACMWMVKEKMVGSSVDDEDNEMEPCTFDRLYKLVLKLGASTKGSSSRQQWLEKMGQAVENATLGQTEKPKKGTKQ